LRSCATYKILAGSVFLLWKEIESIIRESNPQWKMQVIQVSHKNKKFMYLLFNY
jgi:hypothetical protein